MYVCMYLFIIGPSFTSRAFCKNPLTSLGNEAWRRRGPPPFRLRVHLIHNIYKLQVLERALEVVLLMIVTASRKTVLLAIISLTNFNAQFFIH